MKFSTIFIFFFYHPCFLFQFSHSSRTLMDGVSELKNPNIVHVGDSIIFKFNHKNGYNLYIFRNKNAFNLCNFSQATLLAMPSSNSYTWNPSRPGFYYFAFNNGQISTQESCQGSKKFTFLVPPLPGTATHSPVAAPETAAPEPVSGGVVSSSPSFPRPFQPWVSVSPGPSPSANSPMPAVPTFDKSTGNIPFINSNPAVPLPTGEVDSATIRPLPTSHAGDKQVVIMGLLATNLALLVSLLPL